MAAKKFEVCDEAEFNHCLLVAIPERPPDRFDPGGDIQQRAEIDACFATKAL